MIADSRQLSCGDQSEKLVSRDTFSRVLHSGLGGADTFDWLMTQALTSGTDQSWSVVIGGSLVQSDLKTYYQDLQL